MKRNRIVSALTALGVAVLLPIGASAATVTHAPAAKQATARSLTAAKSRATATNATAAKTHHPSAKNASASKKIDINTATREELMTLPGVDGPVADRIIAGRPYKNMSQLRSKAVVTNAEYRKIHAKITAKQSAMHSEAPEAPANGTQSMESGAQNWGSGDAAGTSSGSSDQTTK